MDRPYTERTASTDWRRGNFVRRPREAKLNAEGRAMAYVFLRRAAKQLGHMSRRAINRM